MTDDQIWLAENPPESLHFLYPVEELHQLPSDAKPWNAAWVKQQDDLYVFAFGGWHPVYEVAQREQQAIGPRAKSAH